MQHSRMVAAQNGMVQQKGKREGEGLPERLFWLRVGRVGATAHALQSVYLGGASGRHLAPAESARQAECSTAAILWVPLEAMEGTACLPAIVAPMAPYLTAGKTAL